MEPDLSSPVVFDASISRIKFSLATAGEIHQYSINDSPVSHPSQLTNPFLGLPLESGKCESCGTAEHGQCEGHFGYIPLITPIYHPCHITELRNILSLICLKCMRMKKGKVKNSTGKEKISNTSCFYCRDIPPISITEVKTTDGAFCLELKVRSKSRLREGFWHFLDKFGFRYGDTFCRPLLPYEALKILKEVPEETRKRLAGKGFFPQEGFILQYLPVPPNCLYVPEISDGKSIMSSDISIPLLKRVLNKNELIKRSRSGVPNFESHEVESNDLQSSIAQYMNLRGTTKAPQIAQNKFSVGSDSECSGKRWLEKMKTLFISKGSGFSSRSVICGDPYIAVGEIGLPIEIAKKITFEERVNKYNITRLQQIVDNRLCVTYRDGLSTYAISVGSKGHTSLKVGQIINRRIMDGDIVFINRPPSTHKHSLQAFSVFIHEDNTVKINPLVCAPFGADFDGDCIHIFYPQSLAAKAEVQELFSVDKQLLSSHSGNLNLPLIQDSLLSLKLMFNRIYLRKSTAQQLAMFVSSVLPPPSLLKAHNNGPFWTVTQILQCALPSCFDSSGMRHLIRNSEILEFDLDRDLLQTVLESILISIVDKSPKDALCFLNHIQPLLMETLSLEGYSLDLRDFDVPMDVVKDLEKRAQEISKVLDQLRWTYNELVDKQVEDHIKIIKLPIVNFIGNSSALGQLVDSKSDSSIQKVVEQIGLLGVQISDRGKLYSKGLVEDLFVHFVNKYSADKADHPSEAYGLIKSSFFRGLNPFEELVHSIASREVIVRSSRGLTEPGTLFKNLMAILRDVIVCYDGTVRNICSNSIVQFDYGLSEEFSTISPAGEPVGVLAATAISNPAYKAVLDSSRSTNSSWELMKEILLCKASFKNGTIDRRVILYLNDCRCGKKFCKENAAFTVQSTLKRVALKDCAIEFLIEYQKHIILDNNPEPVSGLVGHIHLDQTQLNVLSQSLDVILRKCQDVVFSYAKKKGHLSHYFRKISLSSSECCSFQHTNHENFSEFPCLQFSYCDPNPNSLPLEKAIHVLAEAICPILLDTIIKGDPRVHVANIVWIGHDTYSWVKNSRSTLKGELAIEVVIEQDAARRNGDAWRIVLDACLPVMHLIDTSRSIPYGIQQIEELLGISCAFDQSVRRLSTSIRMVAKGVFKEHLILVANNMTCTGSLIGFSTGGFKALFRSLKVQAPFTEATLYTPMKCFERASEKLHTDTLSSIVSSCSWGRHVALGTGASFDIIWDKHQVAADRDCGENVYDFLEMVRTSNCEEVGGTFFGVEVDNLADEDEGDECLSPEPDGALAQPTFDDISELDLNNERASKSSWDNASGSLSWDNLGAQKHTQISNESDAWGTWQSKDDGRASAKEPANEAWVSTKQFTLDAVQDGCGSVKESIWDGAQDGHGPAKESAEDGWGSTRKTAQNSWGSGKEAAQDGWGSTKISAKDDQVSAKQPAQDEWGSTKKLVQNEWGSATKPPQDNWGSSKKPAQNDWGSSKKPAQDEGGSFKKSAQDDWASADNSSQGDWGSAKDSTQDDWGSVKVFSKKPAQGNWDLAKKSAQDDSGSAKEPSVYSSPSQDGWVTTDKKPAQGDWGAGKNPAPDDWGSAKEPSKDGWASGKVPAMDNAQDGWASAKESAQDGWGSAGQNGRGSRAKGGWGSSNVTEPKNQKNHSTRFDDRKGWNANRSFNSAGRRPDFFTCEEEKILVEVEPIMQRIRKILHDSSDGGRLSADDQKFVVENVFEHHPEKHAKVTDEIDYMMVDKHKNFQDSRCLYVVSSDGSSTDFSYLKCMENYVKIQFPEHAESFNRKYFKRRRTEPTNQSGQQQQQQ
ncbi:DNA-directed RNA polymerase protein [Dioscorea alata]|uniref:DNA-directed RNA polymerase protein n=3 Tax=Dioscorea alata TaxID=55571 RepID=A0ACB7U4T9_DIOAL|nr:DNA-directed RNA polymerase protein [Dioscorea alata]KAH7655301.1 DNA-directed RNA polymerase protein [Dioscorea alata]KAH7655302.1 DNA-directed RNA polymerase protein [Dioscorea alata]